MRDNVSNTQMVFLGDVTVSGTTPATSAYVDMRGFGSATIAVKTGTVGDAGTEDGFTVTLQESADTTAAAATTVAAGDTYDGENTVTVTENSDDDKIVGQIGYLGSERYAGITVTGSTGSSATLSILAVLGRPHIAPTEFVGTAVART